VATVAFKERTDKAANFYGCRQFLRSISNFFGRKIGTLATVTSLSDQLVLEPWELWSDSGEKPANWKSLQKIYWDWGGWSEREAC
jgi:hypothetical protein